MLRWRTSARAAAWAVLLTTCAGVAFGQGNNKVAAEALFEEGRKLMADGKLAEACSRFADSQRLDPAVGTLLNLANCYEQSGKLASAWVTYRQAASDAAVAGQTDRVNIAKKRADALVPRLSRLTIKAPAIDGLVVKRDGLTVDRAELGIAIPIDSGPHAIEASAPAKKPWKTTIDVGKDGASAVVEIPALEDAPVAPLPPASSAAVPPPPPPTSAAPPPPPPIAPKPPSHSSTASALGVVALGVGVVGVAVGTGFLFAAKSKYDDSLSHCPVDKNKCDADGVSLRDDARSRGDVATVAYSIGAAGLVGGVVLLLLPSSGESTASALRISPTLSGVSVRGAF